MDSGSRRRRSSQEVHELLLSAARQIFAARGYAHSSTREIAETAGVSEALLFRYFGTKAKLFEVAIIEPFQRVMAAHLDREYDGDHVRWLYDLLSDKEGEREVVSFHRFQILVWTLVLGITFVVQVWRHLAMPEFGGTLLGLMGVSAGTYIGFKFPKSQESEN